MADPRPIKEVIIVGAGIGGLATANAFLRKGINVKVFERAPHFIPTAGAGFGFSPQGQVCLEKIGIPAEELNKIIHPLYDHIFLSHPSCGLLARSDQLARMSAKYGVGIAGTLRADLIDLLAAPLKEKGVLHYNTTVVGIDFPPSTQEEEEKAEPRAGAGTRTHTHSDSKEKVYVKVASGEVHEADLVVGADGINSIVARAVVDGDADPPVYSGESIFYGVIDGYTPPKLYDRGEFIAYPCGGPDTQTGLPKSFIWAITHSAPTPPSRKEWKSTAHNDTHTPTHIRAELQEMLEGKYSDAPDFTRMVSSFLAQTPDVRLLHFGLFYRRPKKVWHRGRAVLLGDSCHATLPYLGQGANQAIEDAIVLIDSLENAGKGFVDVEAGLSDYFQKRFKRTKTILNFSWYLGKLMHVENKVGAWVRDIVLKLLMEKGLMFYLADKEIMQNSPVPLVPVAGDGGEESK